MVEVDEFAVIPLLYLHKFRKYSLCYCTLVTTPCSKFLLTPTRMTLNDPECPNLLQVRYPDGQPDVRTMLWFSQPTVCD